MARSKRFKGAAEALPAYSLPATQARREVTAAGEQVIAIPPEEQLAFWDALNETPRPTAAQRRLGSAMRGDS